jgi:hypothetical protein
MFTLFERVVWLWTLCVGNETWPVHLTVGGRQSSTRANLTFTCPGGTYLAVGSRCGQCQRVTVRFLVCLICITCMLVMLVMLPIGEGTGTRHVCDAIMC